MAHASFVLFKHVSCVTRRVPRTSETLRRTSFGYVHPAKKEYLIDDEEEKVSLNDIIEKIAGVAIQENVQKSKATKLEMLDRLGKEIKGIAKEQKLILTDEEKEAIQNSFTTTFASYIELLNAEDINTSTIKTPMDYVKIVKEGGAAEGTRGILAYYLTIFSLINTYGDEVIAPLIIDTPNQQEQSPENYDKILESITKNLPANTQIILCALKNQKLDAIKANANVIHLDFNRLLSATEYDAVAKEFDEYKLHELNVEEAEKVDGEASDFEDNDSE